MPQLFNHRLDGKLEEGCSNGLLEHLVWISNVARSQEQIITADIGRTWIGISFHALFPLAVFKENHIAGILDGTATTGATRSTAKTQYIFGKTKVSSKNHEKAATATSIQCLHQEKEMTGNQRISDTLLNDDLIGTWLSRHAVFSISVQASALVIEHEMVDHTWIIR